MISDNVRSAICLQGVQKLIKVDRRSPINNIPKLIEVGRRFIRRLSRTWRGEISDLPESLFNKKLC